MLLKSFVNNRVSGRFFEDFQIGETLNHRPSRTVTIGEPALYTALTGARHVLNCNAPLGRALGMQGVPLDDMLVFHIVFGQTVRDISLNAVANLGYANCQFGASVFPCDTLATHSKVIGLKQTRAGHTGIVYVHSSSQNQHGEIVLSYCRWVMVNKRNPADPAPQTHVPDLPDYVEPTALHLPAYCKQRGSAKAVVEATGDPVAWEDYTQGQRINHETGITIEEAEHMMATRLYHNTAHVHFDHHRQKHSSFGRRLIYGGHVISLARAASIQGLTNAVKIVAINGGRHVNPCFAGDTLYFWSEILASWSWAACPEWGGLRLRLLALKNQSAEKFTDRDNFGIYDPAIVLDLDYTVLLPKRHI